MVNLKYDEQIKSWIEKNRQRVVDEWIEISKIPAVKGEAAPGAPFGAECARALDACAGLFENHGFDTKVCRDSGYALASFGSGEKTVGLFCHSDVVPVGDGWIFTEPFEPVVIDGTLVGRGVEDNKSGVMASLCAMEIVRDLKIPMKCKIQTFVGSEEETGMTDIEAFAKEQPMPDVSFVPDADFPCSIGEKGIYHFWAQCRSCAEDVVEIRGGEAFNIVLDKATVVLKNKAELKEEIISKTEGNNAFEIKESETELHILAKGVAKHACEPEGSVNAALLLAELLSEVVSLSENDRRIFAGMKKILGCPFGTSMGLEHDDIRFGKLTFVNGMVSMKDKKINLSFDTRYGSTLAPAVLEEKAEKSFGSLGWDVIKHSHSEGFSIADNSPVPKVLEEVYKGITGFDKKAIRLGGGTYARQLKNAFSVGTFTSRADRTTPFMEMPAGHGGAHQCDEKIDLEAFFDAVRVIVQYIINIDEYV